MNLQNFPRLITNISKIFSLDFEGVIWKIRFDAQSDLLALEIRQANQYRTSFTVFNLYTNQIVCKDVFLEESWWLGLLEIHAGVLLVHQYADIQQPSPIGIVAIDSQTGELLWQLPEYEFVDIQNKKVIALFRENSAPKYAQFDLQTGLWEENLSTVDSTHSNDIFPPSLVYPKRYVEPEKNFNLVKEFMKKRFKVDIFGAVDYLEYDNLLIISYFFGKNSQLNNKLLTLDLKENVLIDELLDINLKGVALDTFLIYNNTQLIFIKEKKQLNGYRFHY